MSGWKNVKLEDCCRSISDGDHLPPPKTDSGVPFVTISDIRNNHFDLSNTRFVSEAYYEAIDPKRKIQKGDVLYSVVGSYGIPVFANESLKVAFQRHIAILRPSEEIEPRFLYYSMLNRDFFLKADAVAVGAAQKTITLSALRGLEIALPPLPTQRRIASILSDYDSAIDNARRQIALLEEAAMRLYREWFVVNADPKWEKVRLGDVVEFNPKVQIPKDVVHEIVPMSALQINSMILDSATIGHGISKSGSKFTNGDTLLARITPCLENGKTAFVGNLKSACGASGSTEFIVMRSKKLNPYMVYLIARTPNFRDAAIKSMSGADGRQRAKADVLKNIPYRLPSEGLIKKFGDVVGIMFNQAYLLQSQIESLTEARDRLLPKLMSGEIEV